MPLPYRIPKDCMFCPECMHIMPKALYASIRYKDAPCGGHEGRCQTMLENYVDASDWPEYREDYIQPTKQRGDV